MFRRVLAAAWSSSLLASTAYVLNVNNTAEIKSSAKVIANELVNLYPTTDPNLWWEGAQIYSTLIDYSVQTGDRTFEALIGREIALQAGRSPPYFQTNDLQTNLTSFGQARWALTALLAEYVGLARDPRMGIGYLELAESTFSQVAARWDEATCGGGFNTTIFFAPDQTKDLLSATEFVQLAVQLAVKTGNGTYTAWAEQAYAWNTEARLLSDSWDVYDSAVVASNCTDVDRTRWSNNAGALLYGSALMYNLTYAQTGVGRTTALLSNINHTFFSAGVVQEPTCRVIECTPTQRTYKGVLVSSMMKSAMSAPFIMKDVQNMLLQNGRAIAAMCEEPRSGNSTCTIDGQAGTGEQLTALNSVLSLLLVGNDEHNDEEQSGVDDGEGETGTKTEARGTKAMTISSFILAMSFLMTLFTNIHW